MELTKKKNLFATVIGLVALVLEISIVADKLMPPRDWKLTVGMACIVLIPTNLYFWVGKGKEKIGNPSTLGWVGLSLLAFIFTCLSMLIDCVTGIPFHADLLPCKAGMHSFGFMFTAVAGGGVLSFLAGAVRSGLLDVLMRL